MRSIIIMRFIGSGFITSHGDTPLSHLELLLEHIVLDLELDQCLPQLMGLCLRQPTALYKPSKQKAVCFMSGGVTR